ncbi:hypothetical protein Tco_0410181 [Tanacetum coccineum]
MMTYLKHVGKKKHVDLKTKSFDEIKALYEKVKRFDDSFITIGSTEDERKIKEMNEGASDPDKKKKIVKEDVSAKVPAKQDVAEQGIKKRKGGHMKMIARKRKRPQPDVDSDDEHIKCLKIVTFEGTIDSEIMETKSFISKLDKVSSPEGDYLVVYRVNGNFRAFNYLMEVLHIFDRQDLFHLYDLVMKQYSESTPEGIELILWGDLKIMMESSIEVTDQGDFWNDQQDWEIVTWRLYEACGVCILEFKDGTVIHMLVERKYPLSKELLQRMLDFGLEVEVESTAALDLIRRIAKDVKETLRSDQDLSECLNTSSMKFKESTPKKHEVKQVQQSCLGEDCWELYIPDLFVTIYSDTNCGDRFAQYVAAANCCGQVLWIQNQMLDYGFNFMNTKIYIDNESTICIVKNPVFHSKTKHIEIRHHFIRDAYEKKLIQVLKIHTDDNVADLLTKAFDVSRFNFLIVNIGMINQ